MIAIRRLAKLLVILAVGMTLTPAVSYACSLSPSVYTEFPKEVAASGYLVEARVIRGYDAHARQPEILLVNKIFVGEGMPREFVIHRDNDFFDARAKGLGDACGVSFPRVEEKPRLFALFRAKLDSAPPGEERFEVSPFYSIVIQGEGQERVLAEAARTGRLRGRPPKAPPPSKSR
jgi:hypothetical protein